jgi:hypothetical protein
VADDDRFGIEPADDLGVVPHHVVDTFPATRSGWFRASSTVPGAPGQPGATGE